MHARPLVRDLAMLTFAAALGWWAHGANFGVHAQPAAADSSARGGDGGLEFQFNGSNIKDSLTIYNSGNHTLYVYPAASGSSYINCAYSFHIERPGGPIDRQNCPVGEFQPH
jgi:hypothetical protein